MEVFKLSVDFKNSDTRVNLMRAFAGESQARNRYTFSASQARKSGLQVIEKVFTFTANQEKEHAEIFYKYLRQLAGSTVDIEGGYPIDLYDNPIDLLKSAQHNEYEEYDPVYKSFGDVAKKEGFNDIANSFYLIAGIEKTHGDRFGKFADLIERNKLFISDVETGWICLNCGYVYRGKEVPQVCPVCDHARGYFVRVEMSLI